jgi:hypothetical protein
MAIIKALFSVLLFTFPVASAQPSARTPTVFLTHFYVALDQPSYDALRTSAQVAALAAVKESHTNAGGREWTGFYILGRQTYMEFFGAQALPNGMRPGDSGLALTVEESGGVEKIAARLRTVFGERIEVETTPRDTPVGTIPWFRSTDIKSDEPQALSTWFMETDPAYLAAMHPGARIEHPLSREQGLSWTYLADHPFDNVVGLTLALTPSDSTQLATELELAGWKIHREGQEFAAIGPQIKLIVVLADARTGIREVELRLRHSVPKQTIVAGSAKLLLEGKTGRLTVWASN